MGKKTKLSFILFLTLFSLNSYSKEVLTFGVDIYCPYICNEPEKPGYVRELFSEMSKLSDKFDYKIKILPWERARVMSSQGQISGLLLAILDRYPNYKTAPFILGSDNVCFFSNKAFKYPEENKSKNFAYFVGYDYSMFDGKKGLEELGFHLVEFADNNPTKKAIELINHKRVDVFMSSPVVAKYYESFFKPKMDLLKVHCLDKTFNGSILLVPQVKNSDDVFQDMLSQFLKLEGSGVLNKILKRYNIEEKNGPKVSPTK